MMNCSTDATSNLSGLCVVTGSSSQSLGAYRGVMFSLRPRRAGNRTSLPPRGIMLGSFRVGNVIETCHPCGRNPDVLKMIAPRSASPESVRQHGLLPRGGVGGHALKLATEAAKRFLGRLAAARREARARVVEEEIRISAKRARLAAEQQALREAIRRGDGLLFGGQEVRDGGGGGGENKCRGSVDESVVESSALLSSRTNGEKPAWARTEDEERSTIDADTDGLLAYVAALDADDYITGLEVRKEGEKEILFMI